MRSYTRNPNEKVFITKFEQPHLDAYEDDEYSEINILIVDDRAENLLAIEAVIGNLGYHLIRANSGEEALKWVLKKDFAVIIMDVQMPGLTGFETAKMIKKRPSCSHIPIIFVTAINQTAEHVNEGFSVGAIDYIFKPFDPVHLKSKVMGFVNIYRNQQQIKRQREELKKHSEELEKTNLKLKQTTEQLAKVEAMERIIAETSIDTIITYDEHTIILTVNPAVTNMFGYQIEELIGKKLDVLLSNINHNEFLEISSKKSLLIEAAGIRKDGSQFPVDVHFGKASVDHQSIFVCSIRDITERKAIEQIRINSISNLEKIVQERTLELMEVNISLQNEITDRNHIAKQLQQSNRKLINVLDSIGDAFFAIDNHWHFTYVNKEFESFIGISQKFLIGKSLSEVIMKLHPMVKEKLNIVMENKTQAHFEVYKESVNRWYEYRIYPFESGASVYFGDITNRKVMERNLRSSQERFYKVFDSSPNLIAIISLDGYRYIDVNKAWVLNTGFSREEIIGKKGNILQITGVDHNEDIDNICIDHFEPVRNVSIYFKTKSNEIRQGLLSRELIEIDGEKCIISAVTDITERVLLEKEMTRLDRLNLIGEMAAGIAHEIRNPMTTVRGFLQVAKENPSSQYFDLMIEELDRANGIITEYLTLAKNKITNQTEQQINQLVKSLYPLIKAEATLSNKEINLELTECPLLLLDEKEIRQMLLNLCLNGLEAMSDGGTLTIRTYVDNDEVVLEVSDQGPGIAKEILEKIGTPFFTTKEKGTGLGLSVCYSVANRHNAVIDIDTSDKGTTFIVRFRIQ